MFSIWKQWWFKHTASMKLPLMILFLVLGFVPMYVQGVVMNRSFRQTQIDGRVIEVQNQCLITGDRLTSMPTTPESIRCCWIRSWIPSRISVTEESWWWTRITGS